MFYIIENTTQFTEFQDISIENNFIYPIYEDDRVHPAINKIIAVYVYSYYLSKSFIISIDHPDCHSVEELDVLSWISKEKVIYTLNAKLLLHWAGDYIHQDIVDLKFLDKTVDELDDVQRKWYYSMYSKTKQVNKIIPVTLHKRYYDTFIENIRTFGEIPVNAHNSSMLKSLYVIEKQGLTIKKKSFKEKFSDVDISFNNIDNKIYTWYNVYNPTTRLSNNFNRINFAALSKSNGVRHDIIADKDSILIDIDFTAYHPCLLADAIGMVVNENIYTYLAKQHYKTESPTDQQYQSSKKNIFTCIYTNESTYDHLPFVRKSKEFRQYLLDTQEGELTETEILSHYLQRLETERNVIVMADILKYLHDKNIKLILHTYDSFLFNVPKSDMNYLDGLIDTIETPKFPIKVEFGTDYGNMKEM